MPPPGAEVPRRSPPMKTKAAAVTNKAAVDEDDDEPKRIRSSRSKHHRTRSSSSESESPPRKRSKKPSKRTADKKSKRSKVSSSSRRRRRRSPSPSPSPSLSSSSSPSSASRSCSTCISSSDSDRSVSPPPRSRSRDVKKRKDRGRDRERDRKRRKVCRSTSSSSSGGSRSRSKSNKRSTKDGATRDKIGKGCENAIEYFDEDEGRLVVKKGSYEAERYEKNVSCEKIENPPSKNANETEDTLPADGGGSPSPEELELILRQKALDNLRKFREAAAKAAKTDNRAATRKETLTDSPQNAGMKVAEARSADTALFRRQASSHGARHPTESPKSEARIEDKDGSDFQKKTFSRMHDGETVEVSYKVYIPKKTPALARRKLQR